ncbi:unnamed protein product, partial [Polarella glacialis]
VRARGMDTPGYLREAVLRTTGEGGVALHFVFQSQVLDERITLRDAGIKDGDTVFLVQTPLLCLTASFDGTARIWYLQNGDCRRMLVAQLGGQVQSATFSPNGLKLLTVSLDGLGKLWCAETGELCCELNGKDGHVML